MSLPTVPRDLVPVAASHYTSLTYDLPAGSTYNGVPVTGVLWAVSTYHDGATCSLHGHTGIVIPDSIPDWVPRPPAAWLALAADMAAEVGLAPEPLPVVAEAIAQAEADHRIAELARTWHAANLDYRREVEGHVKAALWARRNRAYAALTAALDAEARS